mgnify:FL=1
MTTTTTDLQAFLRERAPGVIDGWYSAVRESALAFRSRTELHAVLSDIWRQAESFLLREDGTSRDAEAIGATFIPLRVRPAAVGRIAQVLVSILSRGVPRELRQVLGERLPVLTGGVVSGLYRAGERTLLEQQEEIRQAYATSLWDAEEQH